MITKIAFVAYGVSDIKKARPFYEGFLGLKSGSEFPAKDDTKYIEYEIADGNTLAIGSDEAWPPSETGASVALEVDDLDTWLKKIKDQKIGVKTGPHDFPNCRMVVVLDPDKNPITLHQKK